MAMEDEDYPKVVYASEFRALKARLREAERLLRGFEWTPNAIDGSPWCVTCNKGKPEHAPDCALWAWLEGR